DCDGSNNNFTQNFFSFAFRPNDLVPVATNALTVTNTTQAQIQTDVIDPDSDQTGTGVSQWSEFRLRVGDLQRVGTDLTRGLANIAAIRVQLSTSDTTVLKVDAWSLRGGYGPTIAGAADSDSAGEPIQYRYRYRSSLTGAKSLASPTMRYGVVPRRQ